jgi:hypothetical protein
VTFDNLKVGDVISLPKRKGKKFIITKVAKLGKYIYYVPFSQLEMAREKDLVGVKILDRT